MVWSRYSPERAEVLHKAKRTAKKFNKDGSVSKIPSVTYVCASCGRQYPTKEVQVDHVYSLGVTPDFPPTFSTLTWDDWLVKLFCGEENLQVLCKGCHQTKTNEERERRV